MVGDFVIEGLIGSGGMGSVYRAVQPIIGRHVAIKVLNPTWNGRVDAVARFVREARTIHRIEHRGVPDVLTFGTLANGLHYYVMELLEGEDLRARMKRCGKLPPHTAIRIVSEIASILDAAHAAGIIHRDLKPENVFLSFDDDADAFEVKLLDFGIAKLAPNATMTDGLVTSNQSILGTPVYMSPEQCVGRPIDARADIYSLGVLAYEMLSGVPPFPTHGEELFDRKLSGETPRLGGRGLARFDRAIASAMSRDPAGRPQAASLLASMLETARRPQRTAAVWAALSLLAVTGIAYYAVERASTEKEELGTFTPPPKPAMIAPVQLEPPPAPEPEPATPPPAKKRAARKKARTAPSPEQPKIVRDMPVRF
jgi:serine/threonine-protein kinase